MRALTVTEDHRLAVAERPAPTPSGEEVLVRVHGAGVNRADLLQRAGLYPAPPGVVADVPGLEFAGVVERLGPSVGELTIGEPVLGIAGGGGQAEALVVPEGQCARVPDGLDLVRAGGIAEAFVTAHDALRTQAGLVPGERVLVHAAGSGVGTAVIQLARAFGCEVVGTSRTPEKLARARELGLTHGLVVSREPDAAACARRIAAVAGPPDVVIDLVGGRYVEVDVLAAAPHARIVLVGALDGAHGRLPVVGVMGKWLTLVGTVLRARPPARKSEAMATFTREVVPWLADGTVGPVVDRVVPLADAEAAYGLVESGSTFGKVVLQTTD